MVGLTEDLALDVLKGTGLATFVTGQACQPADVDLVVETNPYPGETVPIGTTVNVMIGVMMDIVEVPDVIGMDATDAWHTVFQAILHPVLIYTWTPTSSDWGKVTAQDPAGGTHVLGLTEVRLTVGTPMAVATTIPEDLPALPSTTIFPVPTMPITVPITLPPTTTTTTTVPGKPSS